MLRKVAAGIGVVAGLITGTAAALPASADEVKASRAGQVLTWRDTGFGGCQKPGSTWGVNGAFAALTIEDRVTWVSKTNFRVSYSYADAVNTGCLNGYPYNGGVKRMVSGWTVAGQGISSCSIGIGGNCTLSDTRASDGHDTGSLSNTNGELSVKAGGGSVYATGTAAGRINNYTHTAKSTFAVGGTATIANASNFAYIGF